MPRRNTLARLGAAALAGALAAGSRPPLDIGPLACVALVPLFVAWRDRDPRASAGYAFVAGVVYYALLCSWIWYFGAVAIVPFVAACAAYWAAAGAAIGWLRGRGVTSPFVVAAVWIVADAGVARFPLGGLSWGELGYAFHDIAPARAVAGVGGVALVTFCAVVLNAALAQLLTGRRVLRSHVAVAAVAVIVVGATVTRAQPHVTNVLHVALLQGNDKNRELTRQELDARYLPNSHFDLATRVTDPVDLIVFPESSMDDNPATDPYLASRLRAIARGHHAWVLANATTDAPPDGTEALNLDVLYDPYGNVEGEYAKRHLVPYGEYVPLRSVLQPVIGELAKVPRDFRRGSGPGLFDVAGVRVATVICFESVFGYQVRPLVHDGAEMIVVSTNNRSYRRSANSAQHLAIGQMRAAETGRPVVQAAISGITGVIDADGVVHDRTKLFDRTLVETTVAATSGQTPYVRFGEWATLAAMALALGAAVFALVRRRRKASLDSAPYETIDIEARLGSYGNAADEVLHE